jgi:hypothetical protein
MFTGAKEIQDWYVMDLVIDRGGLLLGVPVGLAVLSAPAYVATH